MDNFSLQVKCVNCGKSQSVEIPKTMRWHDFSKFVGKPEKTIVAMPYQVDEVLTDEEKEEIKKAQAAPVLSGYSHYDDPDSEKHLVFCCNCNVPALSASTSMHNDFLPPEITERVLELFDLYIKKTKAKLENGYE